MNRRTRTLIVMAVAVVCATIASAAVLLAVGRITRRPVESKVPVVFAARAASTGICLGEDDVKVVQWPAASVPAGAITDKALALKRGLLAGVVENEPITNAKLAPVEAGCGLPPQIKPGMRAISVKVNEVIGVAGFVVPGALVDVLVTIRQDKESTSRVVVSNVQVLAAGTGFDQDKAKDGKPMPTTVVTLMVTPGDGERIALAATEGQILLTLRNPLDEKPTRTAGIKTPELLSGAPHAAPPGAAAPVPAAGGGQRVEVIRAAKRSHEVIR